jgi:hypothetical protein
MEKNKMSRDQSGDWANRDRSGNKNAYRKTNRRTEVFRKKIRLDNDENFRQGKTQSQRGKSDKA